MADDLTYGERAVGLKFNPSGNDDVARVKQLYAEIIDLCHEERVHAGSGERARLFAVAITEAQTAQMWCVKALTFEAD